MTSSVLVIQTGGTIDKDYPKAIGGYAFEMTEGAVRRVLSRVNPSTEVAFETVCAKDSQDIDNCDRNKIIQIIENSQNSRIIITHGTDTMIETASYLKSNLPHAEKYIVITGAQKPETFKDSDADFNVGFATGAALCLDKPGVYIAMNACVHACDKVTRNKETGQFIPN